MGCLVYCLFCISWLRSSLLAPLSITAHGRRDRRMDRTACEKVQKMITERQDQGNRIPAEFELLLEKIVPIETAAQLLMIAILLLMVVKPF